MRTALVTLGLMLAASTTQAFAQCYRYVSGHSAPSFQAACASAIVVASVRQQDEDNGKQYSTASTSIASAVD